MGEHAWSVGEVRVGGGFDVHPTSDRPDRPLRLGGVTVPGAPGLVGHSDGDVVCHAIIDALLGAIGAGDLGTRFGVDRPELRDADSHALLTEVADEVRGAGWSITHVDVTVIAQQPRLDPHRTAMRAQLARALGLEVGRVSVKFTTTDGLGSIGRGEGIACWALATVGRARATE